MKRRLAAAFFLLAAMVPAYAQPRAIREKTPQGIEYLRVPMAQATLQSVQILWRDGSPLTMPGKEALSGAAPALMADGPKGEKRGELNELLRDYQAGFSFNTTSEVTTLTLTAPPEYVAPTLALLKRYLDDPKLSPERLATYARERRSGLRQALLAGDTLANQLRIRALLADSSLRRFLLVDPASTDRITIEDIQAWRKAVLTREAPLVVTAGPLAADKIGPALGALFAELPAKSGRLEPPPAALRATPRLIVLERPVAQTIIQAFGPTTIRPGFETIKADHALGRMSGVQGRMWIALREKLGATYGASMGLDSLNRSLRAVSIRSAVEHDKAGRVIETMREEYARWWRDGITADEFAAYRSASVGNRREGRIQPGTVAGAILNAVYNDLPRDYYRAYDKAFEAVTIGEVNAYIREKFPETLGFIVVAPSAAGLNADCVIKSLEEAERCGI